MKSVATHDRPREKLARGGAASLGDNEIVAAVLAHGQLRASALDLANTLLSAFGGIAGLAKTRLDDLTRIDGIGPARAAQLLAAVELGRRSLTRAGQTRVQLTSPRAVAELLLPLYGSRPVEQFGVVLLDTKRRVLKTTVVTVGTLDASIVHPREIFREATAAGAAALVVFHNHPSGDPEPSREDIELTHRLAAAGLLMGINLLDHVILADVRYYSFKEKGYL